MITLVFRKHLTRYLISMNCFMKSGTMNSRFLLLLFLNFFFNSSATLDYKEALSKSILFFEGQRSGKINLAKIRNDWRGSSGLLDGASQGVDLVGGYYDSGDNVKFSFSIAFSMTILSWSIIEYGSQLGVAKELSNAKAALRWGTDYLLKCHTKPLEFWTLVGDPNSDAKCWARPEDMESPPLAFKITASKPGTEVAAEASAALAAASIVFRKTEPNYSTKLLLHSKQLFSFGNKYRGKYTTSILAAKNFYEASNGYMDELLWAAAWLYRSTSNSFYLKYIIKNEKVLNGTKVVTNEFCWNNKYAGAQVLLANFYLKGFYSMKSDSTKKLLSKYKQAADSFVCSQITNNQQKSVKKTKQGFIYIGNMNSQYAINSALLVLIYSDYLKNNGKTLNCKNSQITTKQMLTFSKKQMNYILGENQKGMSYMVGYGSKFPKNVYHKGSSIASIFVQPSKINCASGWGWFYSYGPNPNVHHGAIVGGPDANDNFQDSRKTKYQTQPALYINAAAVGILSKFAIESKSLPVPSPKRKLSLFYQPKGSQPSESKLEVIIKQSLLNFKS